MLYNSASYALANKPIGLYISLAVLLTGVFVYLITELCRSKKIIFHVDAAQSAGKIDIDLKTLKVDLSLFRSSQVFTSLTKEPEFRL